jgi:hypothetical protein
MKVRWFRISIIFCLYLALVGCISSQRIKPDQVASAYSASNPRPYPRFTCSDPVPTLHTILNTYGDIQGPPLERLCQEPIELLLVEATNRFWSYDCAGWNIKVHEYLLAGEPIRISLSGKIPYNPRGGVFPSITKIVYNNNRTDQPCSAILTDSAQIANVLKILRERSYVTEEEDDRNLGPCKSGYERPYRGYVVGGCGSCLFFYSGNELVATWDVSGSSFDSSHQFYNSDLLPFLFANANEKQGHCAF